MPSFSVCPHTVTRSPWQDRGTTRPAPCDGIEHLQYQYISNLAPYRGTGGLPRGARQRRIPCGPARAAPAKRSGLRQILPIWCRRACSRRRRRSPPGWALTGVHCHAGPARSVVPVAEYDDRQSGGRNHGPGLDAQDDQEVGIRVLARSFRISRRETDNPRLTAVESATYTRARA